MWKHGKELNSPIKWFPRSTKCMLHRKRLHAWVCRCASVLSLSLMSSGITHAASLTLRSNGEKTWTLHWETTTDCCSISRTHDKHPVHFSVCQQRVWRGSEGGGSGLHSYSLLPVVRHSLLSTLDPLQHFGKTCKSYYRLYSDETVTYKRGQQTHRWIKRIRQVHRVTWRLCCLYMILAPCKVFALVPQSQMNMDFQLRLL